MTQPSALEEVLTLRQENTLLRLALDRQIKNMNAMLRRHYCAEIHGIFKTELMKDRATLEAARSRDEATSPP